MIAACDPLHLSDPLAVAIDGGATTQRSDPGCGVGYHAASRYQTATEHYCEPDDGDAGSPMGNPCEPGAWPITWLGQGIIRCSDVDGGSP